MAGRPATTLNTHGNLNVKRIDGGSWEALTRYRDGDGVLRKVKARGATKAKAEAALKAKLADRQAPAGNGELSDSTRVLKAAEVWLEQVERSGLAESTVAQYRGNVRRYLEGSSVQGLTLREINRVARIESYLQGIADAHGEGAAQAARKVVSGILALAVRYEALPHNAAKDVRPAKRRNVAPDMAASPVKRVRDIRRALTRDERQHLINVADANEKARHADVADIVAYMAGTGVRISEALAQRWEDVDLTEGTVRVRGTKTEASDAVLHLPPWLVERLTVRNLTTGGVGLVFPTPGRWTGAVDREKPRDRRNVARVFREVLDDAGFTWATPHTLRRTAATLMDEAGLPLATIANQLRHANPSMTASVYLGRKGGAAAAASVL